MKVRKMVHRTFYVCIATLMYLMYDISISAGKFRHVNPPLCKAATLFIRPPSFIQMMVIAKEEKDVVLRSVENKQL